ncbi:hypothetical protein MPH_12773 [Macrophomina phaseolina MS6]|uniref:Uncharacterized protein n=1 Tax=Macrophomina phaseolina (strain MS6) TaxID=1126212 RepID=K2R7B8_MACPH|nr:hypothetical protein MPH_12773 [Macrophomina phaseolina MS6]
MAGGGADGRLLAQPFIHVCLLSGHEISCLFLLSMYAKRPGEGHPQCPLVWEGFERNNNKLTIKASFIRIQKFSVSTAHKLFSDSICSICISFCDNATIIETLEDAEALRPYLQHPVAGNRRISCVADESLYPKCCSALMSSNRFLVMSFRPSTPTGIFV